MQHVKGPISFEQKKKMIVSSLKNSNSKLRQKCFQLRKSIILYPNMQLFASILIGFIFILPVVISLNMFRNKFYSTHIQYLSDDTLDLDISQPNYSQAIMPLIIG